MARDLPDWRREYRPWIGGIHVETILNNWVAPGTQTLFNLTGKGVIRGGYVIHDPVADHQNDDVQIWIDGVALPIQSMIQLEQRNIKQPNLYPIFLARYDPFFGHYVLTFSKDFTYESSIRMDFTENNAGVFLVTGILLHTYAT